MRYTGFLSVALLLLFAGCTEDTLTGVTEEGASLSATTSHAIAKNEVKMIPAKGIFEGYGWFDLARPGCPAGSLPLAGEGGGHSTLLGAYTLKVVYCSYAQVDSTNPTFMGIDTLTTANGDLIYSSFWGYATSAVDYVQIETINGGTGRFEHATGEITAHGVFGPHPAGFSMKATFVGEVSSIGSSK